MHILNFGSLNIDKVYTVSHFVRPGETISSLKYEQFCGGKGLNQSIALANAGSRVFHAGKVGKDGQFLIDRLKLSGVDTSYIKITNGETGHAIIQVDQSGQNCIILHGGSNFDITKEDIDKTVYHFLPGDFILLQNEISELGYIIDRAFDAGLVIALNPSPVSRELMDYNLSKVSWFILNEIEGFELTGKKDPKEICDALVEKYCRCKVVLTLGKKGAVFYDGDRYIKHGIYQVPVVDTTAAGDTFTGFFLSCITAGLPEEIALEKASKAASLTVSRKGAADSIPTMEEVDSCNLTLLSY